MLAIPLTAINLRPLEPTRGFKNFNASKSITCVVLLLQ
jgi:hypothetical protein